MARGGALRTAAALLFTHMMSAANAVCVGDSLTVPANLLLNQTRYCFPGSSLADTLTVRRDAHLCRMYWVVRRGVGALAAAEETCDEPSRSGPSEADLVLYVDAWLLQLHYCRGRWRPLNTTAALDVVALGGWVVHPDDQALHVAEGCVHHYINAAKSRKHDTFIQQREEARQLARPAPHPVPTPPATLTTPPVETRVNGTLLPLHVPPNMTQPRPDERFTAFSERKLTFTTNTSHGAEAVFSVRVFGPRSLSSGEVRHVAGSTYEVVWRPAEGGLHRVHVRLEHQRFQEAVQGQNNQRSAGRAMCTNHGCTGASSIRAAEWVGRHLAVLEDWVKDYADRSAVRREPPLCAGGGELGFWSHWEGSSPALYAPPASANAGGCPAVCKDPHSIVCETASPVGKMQLATQQPRDWLQYTSWEAYGCRYQQPSSGEALQCLSKRKVRALIVGDSVSMQLCSWLQCALRPEGCSPDCTHRTWPRNEYGQPLDKCVENQDGRSRDIVCIPIENFVGPFQRECVKGTPCYHMRAVSDVWRTYTKEEVSANMKAAMERHGLGTGATEDVLLINVGLHDGTYADFADLLTDEGSPWERLLRAVLGAGFHRVIWNGAPAVHSFAEYTTDCSQVHGRHPDAGPDCQRRDYDPKKLLNGARSMALNAFMRDMLLPKLNHEANEAKARVELLDMWQITRTREDATSEHSDKVHPCPQVYREVAKVFLHMLCVENR